METVLEVHIAKARENARRTVENMNLLSKDTPAYIVCSIMVTCESECFADLPELSGTPLGSCILPWDGVDAVWRLSFPGSEVLSWKGKKGSVSYPSH